MKTVTSKDGTRIAYVQHGSGPPLLLVDGAMCSTTFGPMPKLAPRLSDRFTVVHYDRRGRGDSGDQPQYAVEREIEDVQALVNALGGEAYVYGTSSGAVLAARAVAAGVKAKGLVLHEPPLSLDGTRHPDPADFREQIGRAVAEGRRGDAVKMFMRVVGVPAIGIFFMRIIPGVWRPATAVAHTLPYDFAVLGDTQSGGPLPGRARGGPRQDRSADHGPRGGQEPSLPPPRGEVRGGPDPRRPGARPAGSDAQRGREGDRAGAARALRVGPRATALVAPGPRLRRHGRWRMEHP